MATVSDRLLSRLLGPPGRLRLRVSQTLLGVPALGLMQLILLIDLWQGRAAPGPVAWFLGVSLAGCVAFYGLVRTGWSESLSREPSLSGPQMAFAMGCVLWAYGLAGPSRFAFLPLMPLIVVFGVFALRPRAVHTLAVLAVLGMGGVMAARVLGGDPLLPEAAAWTFQVASLASISVLSRRMARMRQVLQAQRTDLREALEQIRLLATRDGLTGLLNRRAMVERLQALTARHPGRPLTLALADLDRFKQVNDEHGHAAGDRVLQRFAHLAERLLGSDVLVARWGGEEFLLAFDGIDEPLARNLVDQLRQALRQGPLDGLPPGVRIDFSAGEIGRAHV